MSLTNKWTLTAGQDCSESSFIRNGDCVTKSRVQAFDPAALPFDARTHTAVEVPASDQLFALVMQHLVKEGVVLEEDASSFQMSKAEKGRSKRQPSCCGPAQSCSTRDNDDGSSLSTVAVSLGLGLFRFSHRNTELKALHQHIGDPVGTGCGAQVLTSLILFCEGVAHIAMRNIQTFLADILAESEKTATNTFQVYRWHIKYQYWQRVSRVSARPVSSVVLPEGIAEKVVEDMSEFLSDETSTFYEQHGIPYKRSYLFYGVPGAGKTSMIQALAGKFGRNLCYLSPTHPELSDDSLKSAIERVPENAIVVLEDVDALFGKNREKKIQQSPLTFSGLLNALDGVGNHDGLVFILTTNFKDQLDAALIRDGRVDMRLRFDYCTPYQMEHMFENFYPQVKRLSTADNSTAASLSEDPEVAALEAKLIALKKAKEQAVDASAVDGTRVHPSGAAFRDALLASLGDRMVSAAQLQHFFVTHRKCFPEEAIADVGAVATAIDERLRDEEAKQRAPCIDPSAASVPKSADGPTQAPKECKSGADGKAIHVHVHAAAM